MSKAKADVLAIDTAHGHSERVMEAIKAIRSGCRKCSSLLARGHFEGAKGIDFAGH